MTNKPIVRYINLPSFNNNGVEAIFVDEIKDAYMSYGPLKGAYKHMSEDELMAEIGGSYGRCELLRNKEGDSAIIVVLRKDAPLRYIAHESFHATHMFLEFVGVAKLNYDTHEIYAYTLDYIFEQLRQQLERLNSKKAIARKNKLQKKGKKT